MKRNIKVVVIESPYDSYQDSKEVRELMARVWKLKLDGYKSHYPYGIMPISDVDYFANHVVICEEVQGELMPFAASKSITTQKCREVGIDFPIFEHMFKGCEKTYAAHFEATQKWVARKEAKGENVGYNASWSMCPRVQLDPEIKLFAREVSMAMYYYYYSSNNIPNIITSASKQFKVDRIQKEMGFDYLANELAPLDSYPAKSFKDAHFYIMHLENGAFPAEFATKAQAMKSFWDERYTIGARPSTAQLKKAA